MTGGRRQSVVVRPATREDAASSARFIAMAEGEMIAFLTGLDDPDAAAAKLAGWAASEAPNRYSFDNTHVVEVGGSVVGAIISFPADRQHELDGLILEDLRGRGRALDRLFAEGIPGTYYLSTMGVNPFCRGMGLGTLLLTAAEERGRGMGFSESSLLVAADKPRAKALYERLGFHARDTVRMGDFEYARMVHAL